MTDHPEHRELQLRELSAENITLVRQRLLRATTFEEQVEVETYLDTLWNIADITLRQTRGAFSPDLGVNVAEIHRLLQLAHDSAAADEVQVAADALAHAALCLSGQA